jgi:hypothetical protein
MHIDAMDLKTGYIKTNTDEIWFDIPAPEKGNELVPFFCFQTLTEIKDSDGTHRVYTTRWMAVGLLTYFLKNKPFQDRILRENQTHATLYFNTR